MNQVIQEEMPEAFKRKLDEAAWKDFARKHGIMTDVQIAMRAAEQREAAEAEPLPKPAGPIMIMSDYQMNKYFPAVVRFLCRREGVELKGRQAKLWPTTKKNDDGTETLLPPTVNIPFWEERILKINLFCGLS